MNIGGRHTTGSGVSQGRKDLRGTNRAI